MSETKRTPGPHPDPIHERHWQDKVFAPLGRALMTATGKRRVALLEDRKLFLADYAAAIARAKGE